MGLDMYLTARRYYGLRKGDEKIVKKIRKLVPEYKDLKVEQIEMEVMYWRKVNAIHKWFVENCQEGEDKCQESYVGHDKLKELVCVIDQVLKDNDKADELLPTTEGFFFGGVDYDEYYFEELKRTKEVLEGVISKLDTDYKGLDFYYHSSW